MPARAATIRKTSPRNHIVLVPGFAGFDALGQLEYYAGVTPRFRAWQDRGEHFDAVLHYFDNFPTAAVTTRAARLRTYLAKLILRGEIAPDDKLALVGHSTGGLDIRWLLWNLAGDETQHFRFDGATDPSLTPTAEQMLRMIRRVVFLSVPQWGTNIADWVRGYACGRSILVAELRAAVGASQVPGLDRLQEYISTCSASMTGVDLLFAIRDALAEIEVRPGLDRLSTALAQEAAATLGLWLRHTATDFSVIDDLTAKPPDGEPTSPAHFDLRTRKAEKQVWRDYDINVQSYATIGKRTFRFNENSPAPTWDLLQPWTYPECAKDDTLSAGTDVVYRTCYRACAGGPFRFHDKKAVAAPKPLIVSKSPAIALWDNDGIVNTASMLWPEEWKIVIVEADHMDIVGHYQRVPAAGDTGRTYDAYDLLRSDSGFDGNVFATVWDSVFDFCS